ncbi:MAG TPA: HAD-IIB family hydrolase [Candidatus Tectomicrobia bacterium]
MRYMALACDYDGTLARDGHVDEETVTTLERVRSSGRLLLLVTGRELDDLLKVCPHTALFDYIVAENGAVLYVPATGTERLLGTHPPEAFVTALRGREVRPLSVGRVIVATWHPHENTVLETIRDLGLELQVIFNKGAVMVLPSGVNKATGLSAALTELGLSPHNVVGIGDAENDHAFLSLCECAVAVANALPMLQERADWVTQGEHGDGVIECINQLLDSDLREREPQLGRHDIPLGRRADGQEMRLRPYGNVLLAGSSQGGKTTLATGVCERFIERGYQLCVIDPEGDYSTLEEAVVLGDNTRVPSTDEVLELLQKPGQHVVVNLLAVALEQRPGFFVGLLTRLQELRVRTGHPHWIVVDETHHLLPASWDPAPMLLPQGMYGLLMITVQPQHVTPAALSLVDTMIAIGESPEQTMQAFFEAVGQSPPPLAPVTLNAGEALLWSQHADAAPVWIRSLPPRAERRRHHRKYAEGELGPDISFYFRGPEGKLNLRAQNLRIFLQLAEGVDDETWLYHLRRGEYSQWFREVIKDEDLAAETGGIEERSDTPASETRTLIRAAIEQRYTAPA